MDQAEVDMVTERIEKNKEEILKKWKEIMENSKPIIYAEPLTEEINHGNGLITILEPKVLEYNHSELIWIRPFYNNIRQSFYFDEMIVIDDRMSKEMVKKVVERYGDKAINNMLKENSYMVECFASYKTYYTRYFITNDELNLNLSELTF